MSGIGRPHNNRLHGAVRRSRAILPICLAGILAGACAVFAGEFDPAGWKYFRPIRIQDAVKSGPLTMELPCEILDKCRPDLADIRVASTDLNLVPYRINDLSPPVEPEPFPGLIFRVARNKASHTDHWVDKTDKVLTTGIIIKTTETDFMRRVELRGTDNMKDIYVVRLDGLIVDKPGPVPLRVLRIDHPRNNFRYVMVRILNEGHPPLKVQGIGFFPPAQAPPHEDQSGLRIQENRVESGSGGTVVIGDLGPNRYPMTQLQVSTRDENFVKKARLSVSDSHVGNDWNLVHEDTLYRIADDDALAENLTLSFSGQLPRYFKLTLEGDVGRPVTVDSLTVLGLKPRMVFPYRKGKRYRLYYGNPDTPPATFRAASANLPAPAVQPSPAVSLDSERKYRPPRRPIEPRPVPQEKTYTVTQIIGVGLVLLGLLLLFTLMLRSRSASRNRRNRSSRILDVR